MVAHFIKESEDQTTLGQYRYSTLRMALQQKCHILLETLKDLPALTQWLRGIDAAANELDTPPEVFAPIFGVCKQANIQHATFHVGEDFNHLLSGIRVIDDAINLLPLTGGDRLGHCTALGIWPVQWASHMPQNLRVSREEWLITLVFIWKKFSTHNQYKKCSEQARQDAVTLANYIFADQQFLDIEQIYAIMALRHLWPEYFVKAMAVVKSFPNGFADKHRFTWRLLGLISDNWQQEAAKIAVAIQSTHENVLQLYLKWLTNHALRKRSAELIDVKRDYLPCEDVVGLQDEMLQQLSDKNIIIETLPTSNIRISQYSEMKQHHIFRWLGLERKHNNSAIEALVSLGSDDPGIFANTLVTDFYHIYQVLVTEFQLSDNKAIHLLNQINERGRIYRFHKQN